MSSVEVGASFAHPSVSLAVDRVARADVEHHDRVALRIYRVQNPVVTTPYAILGVDDVEATGRGSSSRPSIVSLSRP
jgi:hypothetical protein